MSTTKRIGLIDQAKALIEGRTPRPMRVWRVVDGQPADPAYHTDRQPQDIVIHREILKENENFIPTPTK